MCVTGRLVMAVVGGGRAIFLVTKEENRWTKCNYYIDTDDEAGYSIEEEGTTATRRHIHGGLVLMVNTVVHINRACSSRTIIESFFFSRPYNHHHRVRYGK